MKGSGCGPLLGFILAFI